MHDALEGIGVRSFFLAFSDPNTSVFDLAENAKKKDLTPICYMCFASGWIVKAIKNTANERPADMA